MQAAHPWPSALEPRGRSLKLVRGGNSRHFVQKRVNLRMDKQTNVCGRLRGRRLETCTVRLVKMVRLYLDQAKSAKNKQNSRQTYREKEYPQVTVHYLLPGRPFLPSGRPNFGPCFWNFGHSAFLHFCPSH